MKVHKDWFVNGKEYRIPGYLSTSLDPNTAKACMRRCAGSGRDCALWYIDVDVEPPNHCCQGLYIPKTDLDGECLPNETELLFTPYSGFTLVAAHWKRGDAADPHIFHLKAAAGNSGEGAMVQERVRFTVLPLAPWY
jgi:hypothetical protein